MTFLLVTPTGFEPVLPPWKGGVLDRLTKGPGEPSATRTPDTLIKSQVLYQLS